MSFINPFPVPRPSTWSPSLQSITLPNPTTSKGESAIYVNSAFPEIPVPESREEFPKTAHECFQLGLRTSPTGPCLGRRLENPFTGDLAPTYTWETYEQIAAKRDLIGSALRKVGEEGGWEREFKVGIWGSNRPEWQLVSLASSSQSLISVSLYDTLGPGTVSFCLNHSGIKIVFASIAHVGELLALKKECGELEMVVCLDEWVGRREEAGRVLKQWGGGVGVRVWGWKEFEELGRMFPRGHREPKGGNVASICYTSGTTGNPKGAILLHHNLAGAVVSNLHGNILDRNGVLFSYLPLSHIYERFCEDVAFAGGASIGYSCGDNLRILEDIGILKPTFFVSVPRVLNRIYQALKANTIDAPGLKGKLLKKVFETKLENLKEDNSFNHAIWDRILLGKLRALLGGRVNFIGSGSAPISPEVLDFLKVAFSCEVSEGYGQTENCGTGVKCMLGDHDPKGSAGPPQPGVLVKLIDVPEMGYFSTDKPNPRGELCTKGAVVIPAYYKDPVKSAEAIDSDGWLHSGDVAEVDEKGRFKIIDRIKNLVKLSQGEYVALEKVENTYSLSPLIAQIYIHADSLQDHVVAIVIPDPEKFAALVTNVSGKPVAATDSKALLAAAADAKVINAVAKELAFYAAKNKLNGFERINQNIFISLEPFTSENGLLTPTFKTKRNVAAEVYKTQLKALYDAPKKAKL